MKKLPLLLLLIVPFIIAAAILLLLQPTPDPTPPSVETTAAPITSGDLILQPYSGDGFRSLIPQGWLDYGEDAFGLENGTTLVQRKIPAPAIRFVEPRVAEIMLLAETPEAYETRQINGLDWRLYRGETEEHAIDYALTQANLSVYMVLMQTQFAMREQRLDELFYPVLDAFTPGE